MSDEHVGNSSKAEFWIHVALGVLILLLFVAVAWFGAGIFGLYKEGAITSRAKQAAHGRLAVYDIKQNEIQGWMTFRYINVLFHLPEGYLANKLGISSSGYPNFTLSEYAKAQGMSIVTLSASVKDAVASYGSNSNP